MPDIDISTLEEALADGAALIDVREPVEFAQAHVPGARLIPMVADKAAPIALDQIPKPLRNG